MQLADTNYCPPCTRDNIDGELSDVKERLNKLLKDKNIGFNDNVALKTDSK